ncbi:MAG: CPBP family intramembrane glutamic endopeptidase [Parachlamydiales bacterium]
MERAGVDFRRYLLLWGACLLGSLSVIPHMAYAGLVHSPLPWALLVLQSLILFGLACGLSALVVPRTDLAPFQRVRLLPALITGVAVGLLLRLLNKTVFSGAALSIHPPAWTGALASLYGGINEEVMLRLFLFTLVYFLFCKVFRPSERGRPYALWTTNILVALLFGLAHMPAAFKLLDPSPLEWCRILVLNGVAGIAFGWLYWTRGLWTAMVAHFTCDLMIHLV